MVYPLVWFHFPQKCVGDFAINPTNISFVIDFFTELSVEDFFSNVFHYFVFCADYVHYGAFNFFRFLLDFKNCFLILPLIGLVLVAFRSIPHLIRGAKGYN